MPRPRKILVLGSSGNMGRRYALILKEIGCEVLLADQDVTLTNRAYLCDVADGIVVATPTDTHFTILKSLIEFKKPVLCEKPICKDPKELEQILSWYGSAGIPLDMVNQYAYMEASIKHGEHDTLYNFYNTGKDGLAWDCINIIGLDTTSRISLDNNSPYWRCKINGFQLSIEYVQYAYRDVLLRWMEWFKDESEYIRYAHKKVIDLYHGKFGVY